MARWWENKVIYQIYPKSFKDTNGDGVGDLPGIIEKLDYLERLGIGGIWLSPIFKSPQADNGYDVSDYKDIDPLFGTLEDLETLIEEANKRDIKIILDLVLNHTSDEHYWFQEALKGEDNPYHDYYIWRDGDPDNLPNDMISVFGGGPSWKYIPELDKLYFHHFHAKQPDLNWENRELRQEIYDMINWWIDKGVGGFRLDVIDCLAKDIDNSQMVVYPDIHEIIEELSEQCFQGKDVLTVGEVHSANIENSKLWSNPDGSQLSMVFQFEHSRLDQEDGKSKYDLAPLNFMDLKDVLSKWQTDLNGEGWNSLFFENHDMPRIISRWGNDKEYKFESAKMFGTLIHGMQGTPYIYQGQEIGMTNFDWRDIDKYRDVEAINLYHDRLAEGYLEEDIYDSLVAKARDNSRTPVQWDDSKNAGFSDAEPWIDVIENYKEINVASQLDDEKSVFNHYRRLVDFRTNHPIIVYGDYELLLAEDEEVFAYRRTYEGEEVVVICNFYGDEIERPLEELVNGLDLVIASHEDIEEINTLKPYESRMYYKNA